MRNKLLLLPAGLLIIALCAFVAIGADGSAKTVYFPYSGKSPGNIITNGDSEGSLTRIK